MRPIFLGVILLSSTVIGCGDDGGATDTGPVDSGGLELAERLDRDGYEGWR